MAKRRESGAEAPQSTGGSGRDGGGRWLPGRSGNPGGRPRGFGPLVRARTRNGEQLVEIALSIADGTLLIPDHIAVGGELVPVKVAPDHAARMAALKFLRDSGFGLPVPATDMDDEPLPEQPVLDASPAGLLSEALEILAGGVAVLKARAAAGQLSATDLGTLADSARALAVLAREHRDLEGKGDAAKKTDQELMAAVLAQVPKDVLSAELMRRPDEPPGGQG